MQQVLHLLFLNHRKSLRNSLNQVPLPSRTPYEQAYSTPRAKLMPGPAPRPKNYSIDLSLSTKPKQEANKKPAYKISKKDQTVIQKYMQSYVPVEQKVLLLPSITQRGDPRAMSTRSNETPNSLDSQQERQRAAEEKRLVKLRKRARRKLFNCKIAIIFIIRLRMQRKRTLAKFEEIVGLSQNLGAIISKTVRKYYEQLLKVPLLALRQILLKTVQQPEHDATLEIVDNLLSLSQLLKSSSLRKDALKFLTLITMQNYPLPHDFFTQFELLRLDFRVDRFKLIDINKEQSEMIIGLFFGIKVIVNHMFYQPWNIRVLNLSRKLHKKVAAVMKIYASYFYTVFISFYDNMPKHEYTFLQELKHKGVKPMPMIEQSQEFHTQMVLMYHQQNNKIRGNLAAWTSRITAEVSRNRNRMKQQN